MAILRSPKTSFTGGEFSPALSARVDLEKYSSGVKTAKNVFVHAHGGMSNRAGFELVSHARQGGMSVQIPFIASIETDETYAILLSNLRMMFTRNGAPVLETAVESITIADNAGDARFTKTAHGFADGDYVVWTDTTNAAMHSRMFEIELVDVNTFDLFYMDGSVVDFANADAGGTYTLRRRYAIATPYTTAQIREVAFAQDNDVMYLANTNHAPQKLSRLGDTNWTLAAVDFIPDVAAPTSLTVTVTNGAGHDVADEETAYYKVSIISLATGEESLPSTSVFANNDLNISGAKNRIGWADAGSDVHRYVVYKNSEGVYGYLGSTQNLYFDDNNIVEDTSDAPQDAINPFDQAGNYPRAVAIHEQRLTFASLASDPQAVFLSQSTIFENYGAASPAKADDAITFRVRSKERQYIYSLISTSAGLAMFTSSTEWMVAGGSNEDYLTPTNPIARPQTRRGSYYLPPLLVGDVVMYSQARGGVVRDFKYSFEDDTFNGPDRTILARHLFEGRRIVSWCYAQSPYSIIWAVLDDGTLLSLTYLREHDVWGWTTHETNGEIDSVISLPEGDEDAVYITGRRTIGGHEYYFHERMASRRVTGKDDWFFADCALRYTGDAVDTITGLYHLEGEEVAILADGYVVEGVSVLNGQVLLGRAYSNVVVGLAYSAEIETLDLDLGNVPELGTIMGRDVALSGLTVHVEHTRGIWTGHAREYMNEWKQRATENYGAAIEPYTGKFPMDTDPDYKKSGNIVIQQRGPLPMTILAVAPDVKTGG